MRIFLTFLLYAWLAGCVVADPVWPASTDELEDLMYLNIGYRARGFAKEVTPCSYSSFGTGRQSSAEFIRLAFHDMATGSAYFGTGGLDASIQYEITGNSENVGIFPLALQYLGNFYNSRVSMADLIALSLTASVRSCSGPVVPLRGGRQDATSGGSTGVPDPQNDISTFRNQFLRMGFNASEMIAVTACGHTVGGVHAADFPTMLAAGYKAADSTIDKFDNALVTEWVSGAITDPMSVGLAVQNKRASDAVVFGSDQNVTMKGLVDPAVFASVCQSLLQRMIELVPSGVVLTDPVLPYEVKPAGLQLTLLDGGSQMSFKGAVRVRTTVRAVQSVQIVYTNRSGAQSTITTTLTGSTQGFDDTFSFYSFSATIPTSSSISSFNVIVTPSSGSAETHNNGGSGYPVEDSVIFQAPQSCVKAASDGSGNNNLTIAAAVRNTVTDAPSLIVTLQTPQQYSVVPLLQTSSTSMTLLSNVGPYSLYSVSYSIPTGQTSTAKFDVTVDSFSDSFKSVSDLSGTCTALGTTAPPNSSSSTTSSATSSISTLSTSTTSTTSHSSSTSTSSTTTSHSSTSITTSKTSSTSPTIKPTIASSFTYNGCYTEATSTRALSAKTTSSANMTLEMCSSYCSTSPYFGAEYGRECYCGNYFALGSTNVSDTQCSQKCSGDETEFCGAGNRLSTYYNPTAGVPAVKPAVGNYSYINCMTEATSKRALSLKSMASDSMTVEICQGFCNGYGYFGLEYARECYCGNAFNSGSVPATASDCNMVCKGNGLEYCGGNNRLTAYSLSGH